MKNVLLGAVLSFAGAAKAIAAASAIFTITIPGVGSTTITLTPVAPCTLTRSSGSSYGISCPSALAAGVLIANYTIQPTGWSGGIALSTSTDGASSTTFATVGTAPIPAGWTGGATATASP